MPRFLKSPLTVVTLLLCVTLASLWGFVAWKTEQEKAYAFAKAATATQSLTHSLAQPASKTLRESERGYRLLAENVEDIVTRVDTKGNRLYISPSIERLLGFAVPEIMVSRPIRTSIPRIAKSSGGCWKG